MQIPNPVLDFWNSDPKTHFWANFGRKSQSCSFFLKIGTHCILTMLILIPTLVFWIANPKSIFGQIWTEKVKVVCFAWNLAHPRYRYWFLFWYQFSQILNLNLEDADSYSEISFLKFQTQIHFLDKFESNNLFPTSPGSWYTEYLEDVIGRIQSKVWKKR